MNTWLDHLFVLLLVVVWPLWGYWGHAEFKRRVRAGAQGERLAAYCESILGLWLLTAGAVMVWAHFDRDWVQMGFSMPANWHTVGGFAIAVVLSALLVSQAHGVAHSPERHVQIRSELDRFNTEVLPTMRTELVGFSAVSITAGICEEILFRGYLPLYFATFIGVWPGLILATVIFGSIHLYLGMTGAIRALLVGFVFLGLFVWTGSLWPGILLHMVIDLTSGWMAYEVLKERPPAQAATV